MGEMCCIGSICENTQNIGMKLKQGGNFIIPMQCNAIEFSRFRCLSRTQGRLLPVAFSKKSRKFMSNRNFKTEFIQLVNKFKTDPNFLDIFFS